VTAPKFALLNFYTAPHYFDEETAERPGRGDHEWIRKLLEPFQDHSLKLSHGCYVLVLPQCWALLNRLAVYGASQKKLFSWVYFDGPLHLVAAKLETREALQKLGIEVWNVPPMAGE